MKWLFGICLLMLLLPGSGQLYAQEGEDSFTKKEFYAVMAGKNEAAIDKQLQLLKSVSTSDKTAYEGALLMKKAGLVSGAKKKLDLFKQGHKKLESVLQKDSSNAEFRFLRLMIQEHAPGIVKYKGEIAADSMYIKNNFKKLQPVVQEAVQRYSKTSNILKTADL